MMAWIIVGGAVLAVFAAFYAVSAMRSMMSDSETLLWARLQMVAGAIAGALTFVDPTLLAGVLPAEWLPWVLLGNGIATEMLRRLRADDL